MLSYGINTIAVDSDNRKWFGHGFENISVLTETSSGVEIVPGDIPLQFELSQNYPNPFNPTTIIDYSLPRPEYVVLTVYDILGREVAELVNEQQAPGCYRVDFDASYLPNGIYFYRLQAGKNFTRIKKMTLIK